ncbi:MAG: sigma-70 family RNA polymerase sigma factor [Planctomycetes bacterium]|nr:sigma-70 family RNA polymerase sigma factor [Planctomycetota bacterium]
MATDSIDKSALLAHDAFVRALARRLLQNDADADDAAQHVWHRALTAPPRAAASARAWIAAVLNNYVRDLRRSAARRKARENAGSRAESLPAVDEVLAREAARRLVVETVLNLDEPWRTTLLLHYFDGKSAREIANICSIPPETARARIRRALALARRRLDLQSNGDRGAWCAGVALLAFAQPPVPFITILNSSKNVAGKLIMASTKTKIAACVAFILCVAGSIFYITDRPNVNDRSLAPEGRADGASADAGAEPARADEPSGGVEDGRRIDASPRVAQKQQNGRGSIRGRIVEANGAPVPNAHVDRLGASLDFLTFGLDTFIHGGGAPAPVGILDSATTGQDGQFQFSRVAGHESWLLGVNLGRPRATLRFLDAAPADDATVDVGDIVLDRARRLAGKLQYADGAPAAGTIIKFTNLPPAIAEAGLEFLTRGRSYIVDAHWLGAREPGYASLAWTPPSWVDSLIPLLPIPETKTNGDGSFAIDGAPGGNYYVYAAAPGRCPARFGPFSSDGDLSLILPKPAPVRGVAVDEKGVPVAGAEIRPGVPSAKYNDSLAFLLNSVKSGADGSFTVPDLPGESARFAARAPGAVSYNISPILQLSAEPVRVVVPTPAALTVRVQDDKGEPVDAALSILQFSGAANGVDSKAGVFLDSLPVLSTYITKGSAIDEKSQLLAESTARVYALDAQRAIEKAAITHLKSGELRLEYFGKRLNINSRAKYDSSTDLYRFALEKLKVKITRVETGVYKIEGLGPGQYRVLARNPDFAPASLGVTLASGASEELRFALEAARKYQFYISSGEGPASRPVAGARVTLRRNTGTSPFAAPVDGAGTTDASGNCNFSWIGAGGFIVSVVHPDFAPYYQSVALGESGQLYITINQGGALRGRVLSGGAPTPLPMAVFLQLRGGAGPEGPFRATTDANGNFHWNRVPPGDYDIFAGDRLIALPNGAGGVLSDWIATHSREAASCSVVAGATTEVTLDLLHPERPALRGRITINGAPAAHCNFSASGEFGGSPRFATDDRGEFDLGPASPNHYELTVFPKNNMNFPLGTRGVEVVRGELFYLDWNIEAGGIHGSVQLESGAAAANATVLFRVRAADGRGKPVVRTMEADADGKFTNDALAPGDYYVYAVCQEQRTLPATITVSPGGSARADLSLKPSHPVQGAIDAPNLEGAVSIKLLLRPTDNPDPFAIRETEINAESLEFTVPGLRRTRFAPRLQVSFDDGRVLHYKAPEFNVPHPADQKFIIHFEIED